MGDTCVQSPKKAPAATRTPMAVAPMPATLRAPLLPPLKAPVAVGEEFEDAPFEGVDVLLVVVPKPEDVREREREVEELFPEVEDEEDEMG